MTREESGVRRQESEATSSPEPNAQIPAPAVDPRFQDPQTIRKIYGYTRTIAIVGLSPNRLRPSFFVGQYLQYRGYRIVPVNPTSTEILGEVSYPSLSASVANSIVSA